MAATLTLTPTTLSAAVTGTGDLTITVTAVTNAVNGYFVIVDGEVMLLRSFDTTSKVCNVARGQQGTKATLHANSALVYFAPYTAVTSSAPSAHITTSASQAVLPRFVVDGDGVSIYDVIGASATTERWQKLFMNGFQVNTATILGSPAGAPVVYTALGAIAPQPGFVGINGTTLAMTIVDPPRWMDGMEMTIYSVNASAQTLTYTAGFNGGTTARDTATFGGAIGDLITIFANQGVWWVKNTRNVSLG